MFIGFVNNIDKSSHNFALTQPKFLRFSPCKNDNYFLLAAIEDFRFEKQTFLSFRAQAHPRSRL